MDIEKKPLWRRLTLRVVVVLIGAVGSLGVAGAAHASTQPGDGSLGEQILASAQAESNNSAHNHSTGTGTNGLPCNFYSWYYGAGNSSGCSGNNLAGDWCAVFVKYVWKMAGANSTYFTSYADSFRSQHGAYFSYSAARGGNHYPIGGDAITFDRGTDGRADHVGIVAAFDGSVISYWQGNHGTYVSIGYVNVNSSTIIGFMTPTR